MYEPHPTLTPTAKLCILALREKPNQTLDDLTVSTMTPRRSTIYDALRILQAVGMVTRTGEKPATYALTETEEPVRE